MKQLLTMIVCITIGLGFGELYKAEYQNEAHWEPLTCAELAKVGESMHPTDTKNAAQMVFDKRCLK